MDIKKILTELRKIFIDVFDDENVVISESTVANDIDEWDSLTHIQLIVAIEKHFNIKFTTSEIRNFKNVGDVCRALQVKLKINTAE